MLDPKTYRRHTGPSPQTVIYAKQLRRRLTPPERLLWSVLRAKQLGGLKFRKQHGLGAYVADFYCHAARLVVEIDGDHHRGDGAHDRRRDDWMRGHGIRVLRIEAREVMRNLAGVRRTIERAARECLEQQDMARERVSRRDPPLVVDAPSVSPAASHLPHKCGGGAKKTGPE